MATPAASALVPGTAAPAASHASSAAQVAGPGASGTKAATQAGSTSITEVFGLSVPALDVGPWSLLTATGALLAFLIGLFTLIGRERKSPYIINSVFAIFLVALTGATVDVLAAAFQGSRTGHALILIGTALLVIAMTLSVWRVYKIYVRFVLFVDSPHPKHWPIVRSINGVIRAVRKTKPYEHNPAQFDPQTLKRALDLITAEDRFTTDRLDEHVVSAAVSVRDQRQTDQLLTDLTLLFILAGYRVQYMATSRHPVNFVEQLKSAAVARGHDWQKLAACIVAVDAYTSHFGFTDSIYYKESRRLQAEFNVDYLTSGPTYAGLHSASSNAFNVLRSKNKAAGNVRQPAFIIYEDCAALADLESSEQYKVFVRHVVPSERMWGGMFTLFVETMPSAAEWALLVAYSNAAVRAKQPESPRD